MYLLVHTTVYEIQKTNKIQQLTRFPPPNTESTVLFNEVIAYIYGRFRFETFQNLNKLTFDKNFAWKIILKFSQNN